MGLKKPGETLTMYVMCDMFMYVLAIPKKEV